MGILKGNATFSLFEIQGDNKIQPEEYYQKLRAHAFRGIFPDAAEKGIGWTSIHNVLDSSFTTEHAGEDRFRMFALRIDRRVIPAAVIKMRCLEEEAHLKDETGQKRLYREQRESIRESIRIGLQKAIPATPRVYDVVWDTEKGLVYLGNISPSVIDDFTSLMNETFGTVLSPVMARCVFLTADLDPLTIGLEFLTWLWFKSEERDGAISVPGLGDIEMHFFRRVDLAAGEGEFAESVCCQGWHADLKEAKEALRQGKKVAEARIGLFRDRDAFEFTARANRYQYKTMKVPPVDVEDEADQAGADLERMFLIGKAAETMGFLYAGFIALLGSAEWPDERVKMVQWLQR
jgi:recombination associated protein RdgC